MRYALVKDNDIANGDGIGVSFYTQGCPHHCPNCFNPETWDFKGGQEFSPDVLEHVINALTENGIKRHLSILGGEPLCEENLFLTTLLIRTVKERLPDVKIYIWSGYYYEDLVNKSSMFNNLKYILENADILVDGPFIEEFKDLRLKMRGSSNQRIIDLKTGEILNEN